MDAITLSVEVGQDHRLVIQLPDDIPTGLVDVSIRPSEQNAANSARDEARNKLLAAGKLSVNHELPANFTRPSDEELLKLTAVAPGTLDQLIDEDRGPH